jgi:RNA polymerase sigma-70 factor, ECF subfamily
MGGTSAQAERILRARSGDQSAQEDLIRDYQDRVARLVVSRVGEVESCEDLCQAIFVKMVLSLSRLKSVETFESWLFRIAHNACNDHLRRLRWRRRLFVPMKDKHQLIAAFVPEGPHAGTEAVRLAIRQLVPEQRRLLELSLSTDEPRSYEELAALSQQSVTSVRSRLFRAKERLRRLLGNGESRDEY